MAKKAKAKAKAKEDTPNEVFIGKKPVMAYITACVTQMNDGSKKLVLKARGRSISRAVDVAEVLRSRFITELAVDSIEIGTEQVQTDEGDNINVSSIEITLVR